MVALGSWYAAWILCIAAVPAPYVADDVLFGCAQARDCVAVTRAGCCPCGLKEAVNRRHVKAYYAQRPCLPDAACPLIFIEDNRIACCNTQRYRCALRYPHPPA